MRRLIRLVLFILFISLVLTSCYTKRKSLSELRGLMLLENTQLGRNKAFYSRHNVKTKRDTYRKYHKMTGNYNRRISSGLPKD